MEKNTNYVTNLPDFITMQRTSFCWFIAEGLAEELNITVSAVERLINRALTKLKKVIYFLGFILYYLKPLIE